jgi:GT2 family glycosyltransferase
LTHINVLIAVHNRLDLTKQAIESLLGSISDFEIEFTIWLFDDGSTDGTAEWVAGLKDSRLKVIGGSGYHFWAKSMSLAEMAANQYENTDCTSDECYYLWLNNDVKVFPNALDQTLRTARKYHRVVVGSTVDGETGELTYSGLLRSGLHPLSFKLAKVKAEPFEVDAFNGNYVLVPKPIEILMEGLDGEFSHAYADIDYGLRLKALGMPALLQPDPIGSCNRDKFLISNALLSSWRAYRGVKGGGNAKSLKRILKKHCPRSWPFIYVSSLSLWWLRSLSAANRSGTVFMHAIRHVIEKAKK